MWGRRAFADVSLFRSMPDRYVLQARARAMRGEPTLAEKTLWKLLRDRRLSGLKFRRQAPIGQYIADFACFSPRLIVEADGKAHWNPEYDAVRDAWFEAQMFKVLRFSNDDVIARQSLVIAAILAACGRGEQRRP